MLPEAASDSAAQSAAVIGEERRAGANSASVVGWGNWPSVNNYTWLSCHGSSLSARQSWTSATALALQDECKIYISMSRLGSKVANPRPRWREAHKENQQNRSVRHAAHQRFEVI